VRIAAVLAAVWCLGFAAVNLRHLATGRLTEDRFGDYATVMVVANILVLLLKLLGRAWRSRRSCRCAGAVTPRAIAYVLFSVAETRSPLRSTPQTTRPSGRAPPYPTSPRTASRTSARTSSGSTTSASAP
jgi:hypothetical protein